MLSTTFIWINLHKFVFRKGALESKIQNLLYYDTQFLHCILLYIIILYYQTQLLVLLIYNITTMNAQDTNKNEIVLVMLAFMVVRSSFCHKMYWKVNCSAKIKNKLEISITTDGENVQDRSMKNVSSYSWSSVSLVLYNIQNYMAKRHITVEILPLIYTYN